MRIDVQQRLAAISGLDGGSVATNGPMFVNDLQPASWNGVLFFATDSGQVYQFSNPNWVNVSGGNTGQVVIQPTLFTSNIVTQTGNAIDNTIYTLTIPAGLCKINTRFRLSSYFKLNSGAIQQSGNQPYFKFGATIVGQCSVQGLCKFNVIGFNQGVLNSQAWSSVGLTPGISVFGLPISAIDTSAAVIVTLHWQPVQASDSMSFYGMCVEIA
jgi:hypothetical protein